MPPQYCRFKDRWCEHGGTCSVGNRAERQNCIEEMRARHAVKVIPDARKVIGHFPYKRRVPW